MPGRPVIEPVKYLDLTDEDKKSNTLEAATVVKQKRCGKIIKVGHVQMVGNKADI